MDQNSPRDQDASGQVPPANSESGQGSAWDAQPPAPGTEPQVNQAAPLGQGAPLDQAAPQMNQAAPLDQGAPRAPGQGAAAEYAAWSTDATYQNPDEPGQPASQAPDASTAYVAPEPQAVTYQEQPAAPQDQPTGYEQQQQQQQAYDQQQAAYAQQQAGSEQPQQQQPYDQAAYEQQQAAYAQQQAAYEQQQAAYAQQQPPQPPQPQQPYDQAAYEQQQAAYAQQQAAYAQQQQGYYQQPAQGYQQQQYQQPAQPYAYAQPDQQGWPADQNYWDQQGTGYGRSFLAVLAGFVLVTWGVMLAVGGGMLMFLDNVTDFIADANLSTETQKLVDEAIEQQTAVGGSFLMLGLLMAIGAVGIWAHRGWGRAIGVLLGLIGTVAGIGMVVSSLAFEVGDISVDGALAGETEPLGAALVVLFSFLLVFLAMFVGKRHFRKMGVTATTPT